ncbi:MAG: HAD family hydrolase [Alicyclobacillus sp.]|nr:HAD family hydrolase [Alicyclobacillus sp.]
MTATERTTAILFDLDGTLIDTTPVVLPAFRETLAEFGQFIPPEDVLLRTYGMPDDAIWRMLMPAASESERQAAFHRAEARSRAGMYQHDLLFPHARDVLTELKQRGCLLTTASNCGPVYLDAVLDSQGLRHLFTHPLCLGSVKGQTKADVLAVHFRRLARDTSVMVGDRASDVEAAQAHGIAVIGCTYGFGPREELAQADACVDSLPELLSWFPDGRCLLHAPPSGPR